MDFGSVAGGEDEPAKIGIFVPKLKFNQRFRTKFLYDAVQSGLKTGGREG